MVNSCPRMSLEDAHQTLVLTLLDPFYCPSVINYLEIHVYDEVYL